MRDALAELRKSSFWRRNVTGGMYTVQITRNNNTGMWHPHLHCIIDGDYLPHDQIREAWRDALNRKSGLWSIGPEAPLVVDIRAVPSRKRAARYIARYVCSPNDLSTWGEIATLEYCDATHGLRMLTMFGSLHGSKMPPRDPGDTQDLGEFVTSMETANRHADNGDRETRRALSLLGSGDRTLRRMSKWAGIEPTGADAVVTSQKVEWAWGVLRKRYIWGWSKAEDERKQRERERLAQRAASKLHLWSEGRRNCVVGIDHGNYYITR